MYATGRPSTLAAVSAATVPAQVVRREVIARGVVSLFLARPGTQMAPAPYTPGQFVTLVLPSAQGPVYRAYSLSSSGRLDQPWEITIKRQGRVSSYLHDKIAVGMVLSVNQPAGIFVLPRPVPRDRVLVFVAVGSGITPIIGMLRALAQLPAGQRPPVQLHYASRTLDDIIYRRELEQLDPQRTWLHQWHYLSAAGQRLTAPQVIARVGPGARQALYYICGTGALRREFQIHLGQMGMTPPQIHTETFAAEGAAPQIAATPGARPAAHISIQQTGAMIDALPHETLLSALERHGYRPAYNCRAGTCGTCKLKVLSGRAQPAGGNVLTQGEQSAGYVLSCIAVPQGNLTLADGGLPPIAGMRPRVWTGGQAISKMFVRGACLTAMGGLLLGTWGLTDHRPVSWGTVQNSTPVGTPRPTPTTGSGNSGFNDNPTATPINSQPTVAPTPPDSQPTDTPVPQPTVAPPPPPPPTPVATTSPSGR